MTISSNNLLTYKDLLALRKLASDISFNALKKMFSSKHIAYVTYCLEDSLNLPYCLPRQIRIAIATAKYDNLKINYTYPYVEFILDVKTFDFIYVQDKLFEFFINLIKWNTNFSLTDLHYIDYENNYSDIILFKNIVERIDNYNFQTDFHINSICLEREILNMSFEKYYKTGVDIKDRYYILSYCPEFFKKIYNPFMKILYYMNFKYTNVYDIFDYYSIFTNLSKNYAYSDILKKIQDTLDLYSIAAYHLYNVNKSRKSQYNFEKHSIYDSII